mmetsp:Transcript_1519/g.1936  ORF Transcript_1519/g.1936 Transcript_1519/m.1936 type:complete len:211 (-) Transcript_1519:91-723(-)
MYNAIHEAMFKQLSPYPMRKCNDNAIDATHMHASKQLHLKSSMKVRTMEESILSTKKKDAFQMNEQNHTNERPRLSKCLVGFNQIEIRMYDRVLGDNPSVSYGAPLSIGWEYGPDVIEISVEDYEKIRLGERRTKSELELSADARKNILLDSGYSKQDIFAAIKILGQIKSNRKRTVKNLKFFRYEESVQSMARKLGRGVFRFKRKQPIL